MYEDIWDIKAKPDLFWVKLPCERSEHKIAQTHENRSIPIDIVAELCQMAMSDGKSCQNMENSLKAMLKISRSITCLCPLILQLPYSDVIIFDPKLKPDDHIESKHNVNNNK